MPRFVLLSGPSCIGKGPLFAALQRHHPELADRLKPIALYNDRAPRPGEADGVDYHFRPRAEIAALGRKEGHVAVDVRGDLQALEIASIQRVIDEGFEERLHTPGDETVARMRLAEGIDGRRPTAGVAGDDLAIPIH